MSWKKVWVENEDIMDCIAPDKITLPVGYVVNVTDGMVVGDRQYIARLGAVTPEAVESIRKEIAAHYNGFELAVLDEVSKAPVVYPQFIMSMRHKLRKVPLIPGMVYIALTVTDMSKAINTVNKFNKLPLPVYCTLEEYDNNYDILNKYFIQYILYGD